MAMGSLGGQIWLPVESYRAWAGGGCESQVTGVSWGAVEALN